MEQVGIAIAIMTGLGTVFATVLAVAYKYLKVDEDPRIGIVTDMLPGNNCGACGQPGCGAFAEQAVAGVLAVSKCTVASAEGLAAIGKYLGVDVVAEDKIVARLRCAGGEGRVTELAGYHGMESCRGAVVISGGGRGCTYGCLGLGDCERACTFDAIFMNEMGLPQVRTELCTACGDCVEVCPLDLFVLGGLSERLFVQCATPLTGDEAKAICAVACDACGRCAADAPADVIEMVGGLPVIHWDRDEKPTDAASWRCPTGAIQWLTNDDQFVEPADDVRKGRRHG